MSTNSNSNGEESVSIVGSEEVNQQANNPEAAERMSVSSFSTSMSDGGGSQNATDTEGGDEEREALLGGTGSDGDADHPSAGEEEEEKPPSSVEEILQSEQVQGLAISRLVLFSLILITVPLTAMYISYRFVFTDHFNMTRDQAVLYAGLIAAALVYIILGLFAWIAYRDERSVAQQVEQLKKAE